ncbi:GNVR domain-containing protein [Thiothrix unzii]|uniref:GNVR domain-containing protein n=1 Tax=Thiothrix unzii TaxID=111769 RepID=UPI00387E1BD4
MSLTAYEHRFATPEKPISRDKPKRPLVVALSLIGGLMLGVMAVLMRSWWRKTTV